MIIQWVLVLGLLLCLLYAFVRRAQSRVISLATTATSLAGIYFVLSPDQANVLAARVGVGRGADLIIYCWIVISLVVSMSLQYRILALQAITTELARELALRTPCEPRADGLSGAARDQPVNAA